MSHYLSGIRDFLKSEVYQLEEKHLPYPDLLNRMNALRKKVKASGWWLPQLPEEFGGMGLSLKEFGSISEILGMSPYGHFVFNCQAPDAGNMEILIEHGTQEQKKNFLQPLLNGEIRSCFAMTEPDHAGSNPIMLGTNAVVEGDDYIINGHKWFTSSADGAEFTIVMLQTDHENENVHLRASQVIVPMNTTGLEFVRNISVMGDVGEGYFSHAELKFHNIRVPKSNLLGKEGSGFAIAQDRLGPGRIHHCMRWIGICERAFDMMCERASTREISPGKSLASKQTIQNWIAWYRLGGVEEVLGRRHGGFRDGGRRLSPEQEQQLKGQAEQGKIRTI